MRSKKRSVAGTKRRKSKASTTFFFVALLPLVRRSSLRAPNHDGTVVESAAHCCSQRDGERAHERRHATARATSSAVRRTSRGESAKLQVLREGGRATEFCVLRVPALLHLRALRSRYPRAPLLCIPCLVRRHHGVAEADAARRPHTAPAVHALRARRPVPPRRATRRSPPPPSWPHAVWQLSVLALARLLVPEGFLARRTHLSGQQDSMYACESLCLCRPSTAVRTSKRHSVTFCGTQQHKRQPLRQIPYSSACTCRPN